MQWMQDANCAGTVTDDWFYDEDANESKHHWMERQAVLSKVCATCQVWNVCRAYSLGEEHGFFGGTNRKVRSQIRSELGMIGPERARFDGFKVAMLIDEGFNLDVALKLLGLPDHNFFHDYEAYEYRG
jgi:hypothetical protein